MKKEFKFDKATGTMVPVNAAIAQGVKNNVDTDVSESKTDAFTEKPKFKEEQQVVPNSAPVNAYKEIVQMQRVDKPTAVQLVDENGVPEAYLDSITTGVIMFRERQDYDIMQIIDERTNLPLMYIGGYALQMNFNMERLNSMEKIEQCLNGLTKLFRKSIMDYALKHRQQ